MFGRIAIAGWRAYSGFRMNGTLLTLLHLAVVVASFADPAASAR